MPPDPSICVSARGESHFFWAQLNGTIRLPSLSQMHRETGSEAGGTLVLELSLSLAGEP